MSAALRPKKGTAAARAGRPLLIGAPPLRLCDEAR
jgi:hypothetical protein